MYDTLRVTREGPVTIVSLVGKTMPPRRFEELGDAFEAIAADDDVRAVVVRSDEAVFSYGLDLLSAFGELGDMLTASLAGPRARLLAKIRDWQADLDAIARCPVPVICAINGWCIGAGLDVAAACDVRLASADARVSLRETRIAIVADLGSLQRLPGIIGQGHTRELAFTGCDVDASRAASIGLVNHVLPDREALDAAAMDMARDIASNAPLTVRGVKDVLTFQDGKPISDGLAYVAAWNSAFIASADLTEALSAFMEKRDPQFKGE